MLRINFTNSYRAAIAETAFELSAADRRTKTPFLLEVGAANDRICENPGLGRLLGGVMFSHKLTGFPFSIIYEVTDTEICLLYLATT